ncbi:hypothetical protein BDV93DRAFT_460987 [Ceratobasidium sp. AG-I]|nr:hypothetical protein BDV93DRAFT_460987 [Ceratobasidium sp. AG-I]
MPDSVSVPDQVPVDSIKAPALKVALPTVEANNTTKRKRNLIVCIDGTSNQFSKKSTNVIQLYSYIKKDDSQLTYYNSGIGTYAKPSWRSVSYMKQVFDNTIDLAIAWNLEKVIIGAYRWLSDTYQTGDRIFLFGFSRGAYQVRALAAMINKVGLLHAGNQEQIPFAWELYAKSEDEDAESLTIFKKAFSREDVKVHFIGAWDTVSSVGIIRGRLLPGVAECQDVKYFRHALALDERRVKFLPEHVDCEDGLLDMSEKADGHGRIKEVWFAGTHSDIRGTEPLIWMVGEAKHAGLATTGFDPQVDIKGAEVTESLRGFWRVLEHLPVSRASYKPDGTNTLTRQVQL